MLCFNQLPLYAGLSYINTFYNKCIRYKEFDPKTYKRKVYKIKNKKLLKELDAWLKNNKTKDIVKIIDFSLQLTGKHLKFKVGKCSSNPNITIEKKRAHCVGYSSFFNSVINYIFLKNGLNKEYKARHVVGQLYLGHINVHDYTNDPFFKDHDFNVIKKIKTGKLYFIDPSLYDFLKIKYVVHK